MVTIICIPKLRRVLSLGVPLFFFVVLVVEVYPEGNQSNNNQFVAAATGTISAIDGLKVRCGPSWGTLSPFLRVQKT